MEIKSTITAIVAAVVALIIVVVVAIPIIADITDDVHSVEYNDNIRYNIATSIEETTTFTIQDTDSIYKNGILINGLDNLPGGGIIAAGNTFILLYGNNGYNTMELWTSAGKSTTASFTINIDGTWATDQTTGAYEMVLFASNDGDYAAIAFNTSNQPDMWIDRGSMGYYVAKTYNDSGTLTALCQFSPDSELLMLGTNSTGTNTVTPSYTVVESEKFADRFTIPDKLTLGGTEQNYSATVFIPATYTIVTSSDNAIVSMINVIPLLMIVGIIVAVTAMFIRTR